jgi:hypothetical protein
VICSGLPVRIVGLSTTYYASLQDAYDAASDGDFIQCQAVDLSGNLNANRNITVTIEGGYDCNYTAITGYTGLNGTIRISNGKAIIRNLIIKK